MAEIIVVVPHHKRYLVQYYSPDYRMWKTHSTTNWEWRAKSIARYREGLGVFEYRVVDSHKSSFSEIGT